MIAVLKNSNCLNQFISQHKIIIVKLKRGKRKEERGKRKEERGKRRKGGKL